MFEVSIDGDPVPEDRWPRRKAKDVLKVLLTDPGKPFTTDQLIEALLPGADVATATGNIQARVSELRRVLEPELSRGRDSQFIVSLGEGYAFSPACEHWLDTQAFEAGLRHAEKLASGERMQEAVEGFEQALLLYGGDFLVEDRYAEWAEAARSRLREEHLQGLADLASCYAKLGRLRQAISCCRKLLAIEPSRETVIRQLMAYQRDSGDSAQALNTFREGARALHEHLGVEPSDETRSLREEIDRSRSEKSDLDRRRIAVVPLQNYSAEAGDEYIADGMTEELIGSIAKVGDLRVVARTSVMRFKNTTRPVSQIARALNVGSILEGSIRKSGERIRVSAQLIDTATEEHLWAEHYDIDSSDLLEMQVEIARQVSDALKLQILPREDEALREAGKGDAEAHIEYLRGRQVLGKTSREAMEQAIRYFESAVRLDPSHARALASLADAWSRMVRYTTAEDAYGKARTYALEALELDGRLAEAHCVLAIVAWEHEGSTIEAERLLRHAIALDSSCATAYARLAALLADTDRVQDAIVASRQALELDPLSAPLVRLYGACLYRAARFHEAIAQARKAIELDPELDEAWFDLWYSLASTWDWGEAERVLRETVERFPGDPRGYVYLAMCVQCRGRLDEGVSLMEKALAIPGARDDLHVAFYCGNGFYFAGEYDKAEQLYMEVLERMPAMDGARVLLAKCHVQRGRYEDALEELDRAEKAYGMSGEYWLSHARMERGTIYASRGETAKAEEQLELMMGGETRQNRRLCIAILLYQLGRVDEAMAWAEDAVDAREPHINAIRKAPSIPAAMRAHPRFQALLRRVGLAD